MCFGVQGANLSQGLSVPDVSGVASYSTSDAKNNPPRIKKNVTKQTIYTEIISLGSAISSTGFTRSACCRYVLDVFNGLSERPRLKLVCSATLPTTTTQQYSLTFIRIIRPGNVGKVSCPEDTGTETREWARAGVQTTSLSYWMSCSSCWATVSQTVFLIHSLWTFQILTVNRTFSNYMSKFAKFKSFRFMTGSFDRIDHKKKNLSALHFIFKPQPLWRLQVISLSWK